MRKVLVIARREYQAAVKSKAFVISLVIMPILMGGSIIAQKILSGRVNISDRKIVVIDQTGMLFDELAEAAARRNETDIFDPETGKQVESKYVLEPHAGPATEELRIELSNQVRSQKITAFVEIDASILGDQPPQEPPARFHSESIASRDNSRWLSIQINRAVHGHRLRAAGLDPDIVRRATAPVTVDVLGLYAKSASGEVRKADGSSREVAFFVPIGVMMLMFISLMMSQTLLTSALEEKQQRIAEVLLGSASPFELMMGKLVGNVGVSLTIVAIYMAGAFWMIDHYGYADMLPMRLVVWFMVYQVLGVMMFGSIFIGIGAACTELKDAQNLLMPVMVILVFPMLVWINVLKEPMGAFAMWLSLFPPATPMLMILRMSATTAVPLWQPLAGVVVVLLAVVVCVFAAGRVFRIGLLSQGKAPRLPELARWIVHG
jgi:ABC-2 type transport system permease protein